MVSRPRCQHLAPGDQGVDVSTFVAPRTRLWYPLHPRTHLSYSPWLPARPPKTSRAHTPQKQLLNLYASPSILITGRSTSAAELIRSISPDRLLVESDTHDARLATRLVWGACEWMARCRAWRLEGRDADADEEREWEWEMGEEEEEEEEWEGKEQEQRWLIRTVERNWARFMRIVE